MSAVYSLFLTSPPLTLSLGCVPTPFRRLGTNSWATFETSQRTSNFRYNRTSLHHRNLTPPFTSPICFGLPPAPHPSTSIVPMKTIGGFYFNLNPSPSTRYVPLSVLPPIFPSNSNLPHFNRHVTTRCRAYFFPTPERSFES